MQFPSLKIDTLSFMASEALAVVCIGEDEAQALCGFDVIRDLRTRASLRYPNPASLLYFEVVEMHRWIVAETLKYVGRDDPTGDVDSQVFIAWRNARKGWMGPAYGTPEREAYRGLTDDDRADLAYQLKREMDWSDLEDQAVWTKPAVAA